jgi:pimeloyl-ACP methyl ester carboxylesterase
MGRVTAQRAPGRQAPRRRVPAVAARRLVATLLVATGMLTASYAGLSIYSATRLVYAPQEPITTTPAALGLAYRDVSFRSRGDGLLLRGWFIPGLLPDGRMSARRVMIVVHGARANRADPGTGVLAFSAELARHGFAVLAFDMRGMGQSPPAPLSMGYFEQRDVLGAVDFLRSGPLPYPRLDRPQVIGGWGVSMGAATLLLAAAREPAIRAIVADSAYADLLPILEREIPARSGLPPAITPGIVLAAWTLYGIDYRAIRPVDVVARIAPRRLLLIQGAADTFMPPSTARVLTAAARVPHAHVQLWLVPGAAHAQGFHAAGQAYVRRVIAFLRTSLSLEEEEAGG